MDLLNGGCSTCHSDGTTLKTSSLPTPDSSWPDVRVADLFSGCGGLSLGMQRAAHYGGYCLDVRLAVDSDPIAMDVYRRTFPSASTFCEPIEHILDGELESSPTAREEDLACRIGRLDILLGGPPCQGHSNLNNHSRRNDPRNGLYLRMARAAEVLSPTAIIAENVPTVTLDVRKAVHRTVARLQGLGYDVGQDVIDLSSLGVPQRRRRHVILAVQGCEVNPQELVESLKVPICAHVPRSVRWAISDLEDAVPSGLFDTSSTPYPVNQSRIDWLFDNDENDLPNERRPPCHRTDHSYYAMYGRMKWDQPAQTVTTGFNCMGQGRYVHPSQRRVVTPHEAARIQMLPDYVDFNSVSTRKHLAKLIGNAVPPPLTFTLGKMLIPKIKSLHPAHHERDTRAAELASSVI